ncbi:MAG: tetratricopeptide repeat protein [Phycisphaeraceae bacterium]|nr:tetratricopeptide repeat protein [Phycisphaeraceae bacterium]
MAATPKKTQQQALKTDATQKQARLLIGKAKATADIALADQDTQIAGGLMQLQARIYASPLLEKTTLALTLLDKAQALLNQPQGQLKTLFLIQNNKLETLWQYLQASADIQLDSPTWMLLIEAFANDAQQNPDNTKRAERVENLALRAWHTSLLTADQIRIAKALILLRKWDVCLNLLGSEPLPNKSPQLNLAIGQALLGKNHDLEQAVKVLSQVTNSLPQSPQAHLWLAMAYALGEQHRKATQHYRTVRKLEKPATLTWWHGTLGLAQSLAAMGQTQAARKILQVTLTLYPVIGDDALTQDLIQLLGKLQK